MVTNNWVDVESSTETALFDKLKWMTSQEAAFYLRISVGQLRNMVCRRQLKAYHLGTARLRFLKRDLDSLLKPSSERKVY